MQQGRGRTAGGRTVWTGSYNRGGVVQTGKTWSCNRETGSCNNGRGHMQQGDGAMQQGDGVMQHRAGSCNRGRGHAT